MVGNRRKLYRSVNHSGRTDDVAVDRNFRGFWFCRRHGSCADAPVIQSGAGRCQLGLYLVFPGGADAVQLFLWYNIAALYPNISISLPWAGEIWSASANSLISPFSAAVIALVMHQSAYAAEIIRAGIQSVGTGQVEAARALGYRPSQIFRHTILPQAMRAILPPAGNEVIGQLKTTAVVSVISLQDVLFSAQIIYQRTYEVIPLLLVATLWYLLLTSLLSVIQYYVERHFSRSSHRKVKRKVTKTGAARTVSTVSLSAGETSHG